MHFSFQPLSFRLDKSAPLRGLAALAALGLAAAPAHAQSLTLNDGDSVTVSGAGTVGTQNGQPLLNQTTSYDDSDGNGYAVQTNGTSMFTLADGGSLSAGDDGFGLDAEGSGAVTISGGSISAGDNGEGLLAGGSGPITITGGTFSAGFDGEGLDVEGDSPITISGGTFSSGPVGAGLFADVGGPITISGGTFSAGLDGVGLFDGSNTINLFSLADSPFLIDGVAMNNVTLDSGAYQSGDDTISGTLENGDLLDTTFEDLGTINLNVGTPPALPSAPVPEASTTVSLGLLLMLGAGGMLAAKKKAARA